MTEHFDVVIVGAGLSGIGAAYHLQTACPKKSYTVLEGRSTIGGTWDLFRYPGVRSDSDMYTLGYNFKPWREAKAIADGPSILNYVRETAHENGIDSHICFHHVVKRAAWSSEDARWTVDTECGPEKQAARLTCNFLLMCSGYYDYAGGYDAKFAGTEQFKGRIVHPQFWPEDLDYKDKHVVVIGSGATAVTIVPEVAKDAAHVTMLQRSPTYVVSVPAEDSMANWLRARLAPMLGYQIVRWRNILLQMYFYNRARKVPAEVKAYILKLIRNELGPDYDIGNFTPRYNPWDQRMCLVPDSDLFRTIREGKASVVTDHIETFTEKGLKLKSGRVLEADIVVTATGLQLKVLGGMQLSVDGRGINPPKLMAYKGMMFSGVPNLASAFGYTNASWTLKCDLTCDYVCRVLNYMDARGFTMCVARRNPSVGEAPFLNLDSGYIQRAEHILPRQGTKAPWNLHQNYARDLMMLRYGRIDDGTLTFSTPNCVTAPTDLFARAA
ncbi:MAG TPA: NAD(P)/FAD-dependent oxidoreductase [Rhizomicrobium sp.]|jgi:cation diffusion facilitator CzcD-associated flavoprotein CzcO|nr:NAD(P)/FAD-dependent oxidoreductase [Rhizomicrobium sp.]